MNKYVRMSVVLLIISCVCCVLGSYYDGLLDDPMSSSFDALWGLVIMWMVFDLIRKKNITITMYLLTVICAFFTVNDYSEFGITRSLYFYTAETFLFLAISILLGFVDKEYWVDDKS